MTLIELLIAMVVMSIGISAIVAGFSSGILSIRRAHDAATAGALADKQMELYRALTYSNIVLVAPTGPDTAYTGDPQYAGQVAAVGACPAGDPAAACSPIQTVSGPDHRQYRIDTYLHQSAQSSGTYAARAEKVVSIVIRDAGLPSLPTLLRTSSTFDQSTGL